MQGGIHHYSYVGVRSDGHGSAVSGLERIRPRRLWYQLLSELVARNKSWSGVQCIVGFRRLRSATKRHYLLLSQNIQVSEQYLLGVIIIGNYYTRPMLLTTISTSNLWSCGLIEISFRYIFLNFFPTRNTLAMNDQHPERGLYFMKHRSSWSKKKTNCFHRDKTLSELCCFPQRKSKIKEGITYSLGTNEIKEKKKKKRRGKKNDMNFTWKADHKVAIDFILHLLVDRVELTQRKLNRYVREKQYRTTFDRILYFAGISVHSNQRLEALRFKSSEENPKSKLCA